MDLKRFLAEGDHFASEAGCKIESIEPGMAKVTMVVTEKHLNAGNVCQGGALFTLADLAMAAVMNCSGRLTFGIHNNIMFLKSALLGDKLTATATEVLDHHRIPCIQIEVRNQQDELICFVTGLGYRKDKNITPK